MQYHDPNSTKRLSIDQFFSFPYNFGETRWAIKQHKKVTKMRKAVRNDAARKAAAAAKRERRMARNRRRAMWDAS